MSKTCDLKIVIEYTLLERIVIGAVYVYAFLASPFVSDEYATRFADRWADRLGNWMADRRGWD